MDDRAEAMIQIAEGREGKRVRARAAEILAAKGLNIEEMPPDQLRIVVARTVAGRSDWTVWVRHDLLE